MFVLGEARLQVSRATISRRDGYARSTAMEAVLGEALGVARRRENGQPLARYELYSCFLSFRNSQFGFRG
ncbi:MAG: hypothetical protein WDM89_07110 [Rhizomicrobium sp.]